MVTLFLDILVGTKSSHPGIFGPTSAYYCTVEQQGRLTLHLHGLIFSKKNISPLEMKNLLLDPSTDFQKRLIAYIESVRIGEFLTGSKDHVKSVVSNAETSPNYISPELTLPTPPPLPCEYYRKWFESYQTTVDDLLFKSNLHDCFRAFYPDGTIPRFPREVHNYSFVDSDSGHLFLKKLEPWLNDISPAITYMLRCNTDVTSLLSGTAIKAAVAYVTDYITKPGLKTHVIFDSVRVIFEKNTDIVHGSQTDKEKSRLLMTKMVNLLATKLELGSPMIYHYTSHFFIPLYWSTFVTEARKYWYPNDVSEDNRVLLIKRKNTYIGLSSTFDYTHRPREHDDYNLYDWICKFTRVKRNTRKNKKDSDISPDDFVKDDVQLFTDQYSFIEGHPLASTHRLQRYRNSEYNVPNFIGPPLPRPDKDDREYYCCTMLVLYKPWRSGADLKQPNESWHDAFTLYQFSDSANVYIKNMNVRYECLDSRDDFLTQFSVYTTPHTRP
ncbi:hypothetical protein FB446DRAFT_765148 [Lentinula raphanica]|nr:hypothetical protein FB446DRAFT_765148 [Lentinula raphanica]